MNIITIEFLFTIYIIGKLLYNIKIKMLILRYAQ